MSVDVSVSFINLFGLKRLKLVHFWQAIEKVKTDKADKPYQDVKILNVTVPKS